MVRAGVPIPDALAVTTDGTNNVVWKEKLGHRPGGDDARRGPRSARSPTPASSRPPPARCSESARRPGRSTIQLETAADYFERELDYKITRFTNLFEPAVIIFMGLVVGFVAIALVTAMYGIFRQVNL